MGKEAHARKLTVRLEFKDNRMALTVQDDGVGFDVSRSNGSKRFGLLGMKERAEFTKGELSIVSEPGSGTSVRLTI